MSIMTRVIRIFQADMHGVMDQLEDPELLVKQYVREMEDDLQRKEQRLQELGESTRFLQTEQHRYNQETGEIEQELERAVSKSRDDIARLLIRKKLGLQKQCSRLQNRLDPLQAESAQLAGQLEEQRLRLDSVRLQAEGFCSRKHHDITADNPAEHRGTDHRLDVAQRRDRTRADTDQRAARGNGRCVMLTPLRTTLALGIFSGATISIVLSLLPYPWGWDIPLKLFILLNLVLYVLLLCSWSNVRWGRALYPLAIATGAALWPTSPAGLFLLVIGLLGWVRSGICFTAAPSRSLLFELLGIGAGAGIILLSSPASPLALGLACWLFYLLQSLYFFLVVVRPAKPSTIPTGRRFRAGL